MQGSLRVKKVLEMKGSQEQLALGLGFRYSSPLGFILEKSDLTQP